MSILTRKIPNDLMKRYVFDGDTRNLYARTVAHIQPGAPILAKMLEDKFVPAGNTLVAGIKPLAPNCSVIGEVSDENLDEKRKLFKKLVSAAIGVGLDLSGTSDPVGVLRLFASDASKASLVWNRPLRGNMATLSIEHPRIGEFIRCKNEMHETPELAFFNISVSVSDHFMTCLTASPLFNTLCEASHKSGDPGIVFIDRAQFESPLAIPNERIVTCVPCGEQFMYEGETCTLGAINLDRFVTKNRSFDYDDYSETIRNAVSFLDATIDKLVIPDPYMTQRTRSLRRIGLGVMGFANLLAKMYIPYESQEALNLASLLAQCLTSEADKESVRLGGLLGPHPYSTTRRNITLTCLQPTGGVRRLFEDDGFSIEPFFTEATRISPAFAVKMTAAWQQHIENAVSKTINLPHTTSPAEIGDLYRMAHHDGCKGITVYRDACRSDQPMALKAKCESGECIY